MGNQSDTYNYNDQANIYTIACWVEDDLIAKGYTVSPLSTNMPNTAVAPHTNLICVRKDTDGYYKQYDNYIFLVYDYHFMKLCENGYWTHKPGGTNPLRYLYTPTNGREWVGEWSVGSQTFRDEELTYDSEIYFIEYSTTHTYAWKYCGSDQHIRTCTICGDTTGLPMFCRYNSEDLCTLCDHYGGIDQADSIGDKTIICDHA